MTLLFNNAGYIVTGFFAETPIDKWLANAQCNAMAGLSITHHFLGRMREQGRKGCIAFTSRLVSVQQRQKAEESMYLVTFAVDRRSMR